ncbi:sigma-70 family RNA polymerase sigma factor [Enterococcus gallinarum]|nr:sigma-70 family RNA polymerase sigma factor [Enterococcus gallinarum]MBO6352018.1 sigma-70 family RNA polymerase sigma factor [Enterococcus gallinarum]MBO6393539.1 sigma-70 family RNA polymerase sigma factor [Enterococcus gallinarum]MBO6424947.1 sigma-70 family RNA polymerase sigma factor [Enterococcus gallinarum]
MSSYSRYGGVTELGDELLAKIYKDYSQDCYLYAFYFTKNKEQAQDLVSEAFLVIAESLDELNEKQINYFLLKIIKNRFIDWTRKQTVAHRWRKFPSHVFQAESQQLSTPLEEIIGQERKRALYRSNEKLPKDTREVILLYYFLEWRIEEIATYKEWSYTQAKNRLYRGRQLLKEELTNE